MNDIRIDIHNLTFGVRRSVRYHLRRSHFFDRLNKWITFICALSGTATFATLIGDLDYKWSMTAALVVAISSVFDLVVNTSQCARSHTDLARRFIQLEEKLVSLNEPTEEALQSLTAERLSIESDEPPVRHVLNCICHNELARAMGYAEEHYVPISKTQRFFAHIFELGEDKLHLKCTP